jgi:hypothetical protein
MRSDYIPSAPTSVTGKVVPASRGPAGQIEFSWPAIQSPPQGSGIDNVFIEVNGVRQSELGPNATSFVFSGAPGTSYTAVVWAQNGADKNYGGVAFPWNKTTSNAVTAVGPPTEGSVSASVVNNQGGVGVEWSGFGANGAAGLKYSVARYADGAPVPSCAPVQGDGSGSGAVQPSSEGDIGKTFVFVVTADNGWGCSQAKSSPIRVLKPPQPPTVTLGYAERVDGRYAVDVDSATPNKLPNTRDDEYTITVNGGSTVTPGSKLDGSGPWTFVSCIERLCSEPGDPSNSLAPVDANATVGSCVAEQPVSVSMVSPGALSWSYEYAFRSTSAIGPGLWSEWSSNATAPALGPLAESQQVAVRTTATQNGTTFHNADRPQDLPSYWKTCG